MQLLKRFILLKVQYILSCKGVFFMNDIDFEFKKMVIFFSDYDLAAYYSDLLAYINNHNDFSLMKNLEFCRDEIVGRFLAKEL